MGIPLYVGAPPKTMMFRSNNWLDRRNNSYLKLSVTPYSIDATNFTEVLGSIADGHPPFNIDFKSMVARANKLGCSYPENTDVSELIIYVLQEGAISETYGNSISPEVVTGKLEQLASNDFVKFFASMHNNFGTDLGQSAGSLFKSIGETFNIEGLKGINPNEWSNMFKGLKSDQVREKISNWFKENNILNGQNSEIASKYVQTGFNILLGNRPIYPYLWDNSTSSANYTFRVRLYNPNPCSLQLHQKCIVDGLAILKSLTLPSTMSKSKTNEEQNNNTTYGPPLYVGLESKGLFKVNYGMIENMSVVYGGDENSIAFNGRPNYVDVSFSVKPLYPVKVITDDLALEKSPANDYISMNVLQDNNDENIKENSEDVNDVNEEGVESGREVNMVQSQSDVVTEHRGGTEAQRDAFNDITNGGTSQTTSSNETSESIEFSTETGKKYSFTVNGETRESYGDVSTETLDWYYNSRTPKQNFYTFLHTKDSRIEYYLGSRSDVQECIKQYEQETIEYNLNH